MTPHFIFYDTETTGTNIEKDRVIEIAAYNPETDQSFVSYVNPGVIIPEEASTIHGITNDIVAEAPDFPAVIDLFINFCGENTILVAHNNDNFDFPLLENECLRHSISLPKYSSIDSLKWAKKYRPDLPKHNLQYLRQVYGFSENRAHRALDDVIILHKVFSAMIGDLAPSTVLNLLSGTSSPKTFKMPFGKYKGKKLTEVPNSYIQWLQEQGVFDKPENKEIKQAVEALGL
ncbi:putative quorum-sensing-regulated virulence factor [Chlamydiifrater phoenicopteri]|uniref:putative quorum-sensing-regulated virulence factor n=1 Tax=Chlamydiifrater phoenicopteri TaxID=2681469 RepID=UPI001BCDBCE3|nr:DUF3820 family protein [Chlamydiifrater phoenicopteri]